MKIITPGRRPFVALGILFGILAILSLFIGFSAHDWLEAGKAELFVLGLACFVFGSFMFTTIEVDEASIRLKNFGFLRSEARFSDITHSLPSVLAEKDWPVLLTIYRKNLPPMIIRMKILSKPDVDWLLSMPDLRVVGYEPNNPPQPTAQVPRPS